MQTSEAATASNTQANKAMTMLLQLPGNSPAPPSATMDALATVNRPLIRPGLLSMMVNQQQEGGGSVNGAERKFS
jgi:hypothetical protein